MIIASSDPIQALDEISCIVYSPPPSPETTKTGNFRYMYIPNILKTNSMEDNLNGRQPQWKIASMGKKVNGG